MGKMSIKQIAKSSGLHANWLLKSTKELPDGALSQGFGGDLQVDDAYIDTLIEITQEKINEQSRQEEAREAKMNSLIITSGFDIHGYKIVEYREFITAEAVFGIGILKGTLASVSDLAGTESGVLSEKIQDARELAMNRFKEKAISLGCDAIIGTDLDMTMFGETLLGVVINGTAVVIEPITS